MPVSTGRRIYIYISHISGRGGDLSSTQSVACRGQKNKQYEKKGSNKVNSTRVGFLTAVFWQGTDSSQTDEAPATGLPFRPPASGNKLYASQPQPPHRPTDRVNFLSKYDIDQGATTDLSRRRNASTHTSPSADFQTMSHGSWLLLEKEQEQE